MTMDTRADLIVVGAGIVGLAHAVDAHLRGLKVQVLERDQRAVGASIRNFGHVCTTAQSGQALAYAQVARERWLKVSALAGFDVAQHGTVAVARTADEMAVLTEFAEARGADQAVLLTPGQVAEKLGWPVPDAVGGAWMPYDLRVDPRAAVPAIAAWLQSEGVDIRFGVNAGHVADGTVLTNQGTFEADRVVHASGHDVDRLFPGIAAEYEVQRCRLQMLEVAPPRDVVINPAVFTGTSLLRYDGFAEMPSAAKVRATITTEQPDLLENVVNLMMTQRPDGNVVLGDTHHYDRTHLPFDDESMADLLLREGERLFGQPLTVRKRWRGVYASSTRTNFLIAAPDARTRVVSVTSGIGMTTGLGLAPAVLDEFLD